MRKRVSGVLSIVLIAMFLVASLQGCQGTISSLVPPPDALKNPFVKSSYKVLFSMAQAYNAAWKSFKDLNEVGVVTDATFLKGKELARKYVKANKEAVDVLIAVEKGTSGQVEAQALITSVQIANDAIMVFLKPYLASQIKS